MRNIGFVLLAVAVVLAGLTVWGLRQIASARPQPEQRLNQTTVVVATRPLGFGDVLSPEVLRVQAWPSAAQPQGSFKTIAEVTAQRRVALGPIAVNEPLLASRVSGPGGRATLSGVIRTGMRATTIRVNDVFGVAGFVLPGDFVDVLITRGDGAGVTEPSDRRTDVLLRSIRVLAVDQLANENKNDPVVAKAATIEVTPEQAQKLALAADVGVLSLALRGTADPLAGEDELAPATVRVADLALGKTAAAAPARPRVRRAPAAPSGPTIKIIRGADIELVRLPQVG
ncbi:Flp pilus assembly protein CpaB [Phenylobacterium sp.]|jgi:pilus assembly protein CpaB|uniref:Flp pilus assembly protein CpaB n=1 Tax=Phenylobacterium sp. TaxID=1871053 RepID=UPI003784755E